MIKNYFKIAVRNIRRHATYSILNISGMAIGMACAILILLWVQDEWSYDRHFENAGDLYRINENKFINGKDAVTSDLTPSPLAAALKTEYPEITSSSRYLSLPISLPKGDEFILEECSFVDKDFLKMFNIRLVNGDLKSALSGPHDILITEEMAHKYFGNEDPIGKSFTEMKSFVFTVTGVVKKLSYNSHIRFDFLIPFEFLTEFGANINDWGNIQCSTYVQLNKGTDSKIFDKKILDFLRKDDRKPDTEIFLQNIKKIHLYSSGDITYVRILSLIAVFILIIACINFMNLSTAQSGLRAKEIGLRKVVGANKRKIVAQFLIEALLIVFMAYAIAMIIVELLLPGFSNLLGKQLVLNYKSAGLYIGLITIVLFCSLLAGSYPAFFLSSLKPLNIIKGIINKNSGNAGLRRVLVIFQFTLSVVLIICTLIVESQLKYIQKKDLGLNIDDVGFFQFSLGMQRETLKKDLINSPDIISATIAGENSFISRYSESGFSWEGKKEGTDALFQLLFVDADYAKTFQLQLKGGRFFSNEFPTDNNAIVINEKAVEIIGFKDPIGKTLTNSQGLKLTIIGVVKDFHYQSFHTRIEPLIMHMGDGNFCFIRMKHEHINLAVDYIRKTFKSYNLTYPMEFKFLNDEYDKLYRKEQRMGKIFGYFSLLAIIISCLGLIGLSSFMTERRTKEIGIRKVNGAKSFEIFFLLSKEYVIWVGISIITACPIALYLMHKWLQKFAYRIEISWWVFVLAGVIALLITLLTVSWQSYRATNKNPIEALRYE
jgi:putative ABC transport system permease protein